MTESERVKVDAIVVGGGPAGLSAAYTMASAGLQTIVIERGEYAGAKNVGGLVYGTVLNRMIPKFYEQAPIERSVARRELIFLGTGEHIRLTFGADEWARPPYNNTFIVHRSQFDRWYAKQVEAAGATLLESTVAESLIYEEKGGRKRAVGVRVRGDEEFYADVVVLADGANALVTEQTRRDLGLRPGRVKQEYAVGVKEIIALPRGRIEDRFNLSGNEGAALDFFGVPFEGIIGGGFLYTARETIHLGFAARIESLRHAGLGPSQVMERFKEHPIVRRYIEGGELQEYSAHMIPEGGFDAIGQLAGDGVMIAGDAAGFVNMSLYKEGTNHAMETGRSAGETAVEAHRSGNVSAESLAAYERRVRGGVAYADLKRYRKVPEVLEACPNLLSLYPKKVNRMLIEFFTVTDTPKRVQQRQAIRNFLRGLPKFRFVRDLIRARHLA